eukprot:GEMP01036638.1.p1 GENE.GEMP01036638.1~~GEMP01036638.1.p1  ORF type:complete len:343 (+),score=28.91 GEMP01036638.1:231-1259(+)
MLYWTILCLCLQARNPGSNQEPLSPSTRGANSASLRVEDDGQISSSKQRPVIPSIPQTDSVSLNEKQDVTKPSLLRSVFRRLFSKVTVESVTKYIKEGCPNISNNDDSQGNFNRLASAFDGFTAETAKKSAQFFRARATAKTLPGMSLTSTLAKQNCDTILKGLTITSDKKEDCQNRIIIMIDHRNGVSAEDFEIFKSQQIPQIAGDRTEHIKTIIAGDIIIIDYINPKKKSQALTDKKEGANSIEEAIDFVVHVKDRLTIGDNSGNFMDDVKRLENLEPLLTFFAGVKSHWKMQLMEDDVDDEADEVIKMETKLKPFEHFISAVTGMFDFDKECNIKQNTT